MDHRITRRLRAACLIVALAAAWTQPLSARTLPPIDALATASAAPVARSAALSALQARDASATIDARFAVPTFLWGRQAAGTLDALARTPTPKLAGDDVATARAHLRDMADLYRITGAEIDALPMHNLQPFPGGGAIVRFRGQVDGIEVFREQVNVVLDKAGGLVAIGGFAMGAPEVPRKSAAVFTADPGQALAGALADFGFDAGVAQRLLRGREEGGYTHYTLPAGTVSADGSSLSETARVKRVWFRLPAQLVPAYYVEVQVRDGNAPHDVDYYAYVIAAADGAVLYRHNQTVDAFSYRVHAEPTPPFLPLPGPGGRGGFPHPTGTPDGYQPSLAPGNLVTLDSAPFSRNDPWLAPQANRTVGNNVDAFSNMLDPDNYGTPATDECNLALPVDGDMRACVTSPGTFDHVYNFGSTPNATRSQVAAAVTNLFYMNNYLHDWFYDAGFDEVAGNAQTSNFGRGGLGGDSIFAEAQDKNGTNNANMSTPADGQRPRMRMFLWSSSIALAKVQAPPAIAGAKQAGTAEFGPQAFDLTGDLVVALDAVNPEGPTTTDGCTAFTNTAAVAGKIAVVDRGVCTFVVKAKNAQSAGAAGVLVINNVAPGAPGMAGTDATVTIPAISVSLADGLAIKAQLALPAAGTLRMARQAAVPRDGALDNTLIAHEWGHYISNRLIGNGNGLGTQQSGGLGEGWADFHSLLLFVKEADRSLPGNADFAGAYPETPYALGGPDFAPDVLNNAFYFGIRRYPYSRDMAKNPLTLKHIADSVALPGSPAPSPRSTSSLNTEVHNTGEVWASLLWECYTNLLNDTARLSFAQAQDRMKRYLVGSYKVSPVEPNLIAARDALLAVMEAQDPADRDLCMQGFAKRGAGVGAYAPPSSTGDHEGVVESYRATADAVTPTAVVEYYHAAFDHYFVTNIADEIAKLDNGTFVGWTRTGESFNVYAAAGPGTADVCRFFSTAFTPKSSHFYTANAVECATVRQNPNWQFEAAVFAVPTPDAQGACAAGTQPVYRLYNNGQGAAPNHRYTTNLATRTQMLAKGWIPEGNGTLGVSMCAPQ